MPSTRAPPMPRDSTKDKIAEDLANKVIQKFMRDAMDACELAAVANAERQFEAVLLAHTIAVAASGVAEATTIKPEEAGEMFAMMVAARRRLAKKHSRRQEG
jgi:hypothetical protein